LPVYRLGVTDWWRKIDMWTAGRAVDRSGAQRGECGDGFDERIDLG
jgi:hypothetical protein